MKITLNPHYVLKQDDGCVLLLGKKALADATGVFEESVNSVIHPFHAKILSYVNGEDYDVIVDRVSSELEIDKERVKYFIDKLIENPNRIGPVYKSAIIGFPRHTIIKSDYRRPNVYKPSDFDYDHVDVNLRRHVTPSTITLMIDNICTTNCVYCYADKRRPVSSLIPLERVGEILKEAREIGVVDFDLIGGEVFLYKNWRELVKMFLDNGFEPYLSTKHPLDEDGVKYLASIGLSHLQISLDSMIPEHLQKILDVKLDYASKMQNTFRLLEKYGIPVVVHSIINRYNDSVEDLESIYKFLSTLKNVRYWLPEVVGPSIYAKTDFDDFKPRKGVLGELSDKMEELIAKADFKIVNGINKEVDDEGEEPDFDAKMNSFMSRGLCSGNFSHMYILPTGEVTICEELYWNKHFIIGDVKIQSLMDVWTSDKAKSLINACQKDFPEDSPCHKCDFFSDCRDTRQICYRDTIKAYGEDKWYYPDVSCPFAPTPKYSTKL